MSKVTKDPGSPVARRLKQLQEAEGKNGPQYAAFLGIEYSRWHNLLRGSSLSATMANLIRRKTGASLDWLYHGDINGMPVALARRLGVLDEDRKVQ
jgi:hypothetical protein